MGQSGYLSAVGLSLGFEAGIGIGLVCFRNADGPAPWTMVGHSIDA